MACQWEVLLVESDCTVAVIKSSRTVCVERRLHLRFVAFALKKRFWSISFAFCCVTVPLCLHLRSIAFEFWCICVLLLAFQCISFRCICIHLRSIAFAFKIVLSNSVWNCSASILRAFVVHFACVQCPFLKRSPFVHHAFSVHFVFALNGNGTRTFYDRYCTFPSVAWWFLISVFFSRIMVCSGNAQCLWCCLWCAGSATMLCHEMLSELRWMYDCGPSCQDFQLWKDLPSELLNIQHHHLQTGLWQHLLYP